MKFVYNVNLKLFLSHLSFLRGRIPSDFLLYCYFTFQLFNTTLVSYVVFLILVYIILFNANPLSHVFSISPIAPDCRLSPVNTQECARLVAASCIYEYIQGYCSYDSRLHRPDSDFICGDRGCLTLLCCICSQRFIVFTQPYLCLLLFIS